MKNTEDAINDGHESITQQTTNLKLKNERVKQCYKPIILQPLAVFTTHISSVGKCMPFTMVEKDHFLIFTVHYDLDKKLKLIPQNIKYCQGNET